MKNNSFSSDYQNKYFTHGVGSLLSRHNNRIEKELNLNNKERKTILTREIFKKHLQSLSKMDFKSLPALNQPQQHSFVQRLFSWLNGTDRTLFLHHKEVCANCLEHEAMSMESVVATINRLHEQYKNETKELVSIAEDAVDYDFATRCGWAWWW